MSAHDDGLSTVIRIARRAVGELEATDLLDALWLATRITARPGALPGTPAEPRADKSPATPPPPTPDRKPSRAPSSASDRSPHPAPAEPARGDSTYTLDLPYRGAYAADQPTRTSPTLGRAASPLADRLGFCRALRPLKRNAESTLSHELDEDATARESAETGALLPSMRPSLERWLDLDVVVDTSPTMTIWHPTIRRFKHLLLNAGVFRRTRFWSWDAYSSPEVSRLGSDWPTRARPSRPPAALATPGGRQVVLVLTDAVSDGWHTDLAARAIQVWSHHAAVALLPMLPARMWARTGLANAEPALIDPATPATPSQDLTCAPRRRGRLYQRHEGRLRRLTFADWRNGRPVVAVTALQPTAFARLARFVAGHAAEPAAGLCLPTPGSTTFIPAHHAEEGPQDEQAAFHAFRAGASPSARQLARYLAALGYFSLEVIRLVRQTLVPQASVADEAEVLLSGLTHVVRSDQNPERVIYAYPQAVREALRGEMTVQTSYQVLRRVFGFWASAAGFAEDSLELLIRKGPQPSTAGPGSADALAAIAAEVLRDIIPARAPTPVRRLRRPRVHVQYTLDVHGVHKVIALPFVVGVIADLSGSRSEPLPPLSDRRFTTLNLDNFDNLFRYTRPRLWMRVPDRLTNNDGELGVDLVFTSMSDFEPDAVAARIPPLAALLETRARLKTLLSALDSSPQLEEMIGRLLRDDESRERIRSSADDAAAGSASSTEPPSTEGPWSSKLEALLSAARPKTLPSEQDVGSDLRALVASVSQPMATSGVRLTQSINEAVARIDLQVSRQLAEVMHHPDFQKLEGTWRGLHYLVRNTESDESLFIRVLNASKRDLHQDLHTQDSPDDDDGRLLRMIHDQEYGVPGGTPYGVLISDFEFSHQPEDMELLRYLGGIARRSLCPFIAGAAPELFGVSEFSQLEQMRSLPELLEGPQYTRWRAFRQSNDARFVALTCPRVLARQPHQAGRPDATFDFDELPTSGSEASRGAIERSSDYCWMSAAWAFGGVLTRAFKQDGWCVQIRGVENGGAVTNLPVHGVTLDLVRGPTEVEISSALEHSLSEAGLLPLCSYKHADYAAFFSAKSLYWPESIHLLPDAQARLEATAAARLPDTFAISRFLQYMKVIVRDRIGLFSKTHDLERWLQDWINRYISTDPDASMTVRAERPLRSAQVTVREDPNQRMAWTIDLQLSHGWSFDPGAVISLTTAAPGSRS